MFETVVPGGPLKGERLEKEKFDKMLDEYYAVSGWDEKGIPREETFKKYGLLSEWETFSGKMKISAPTGVPPGSVTALEPPS